MNRRGYGIAADMRENGEFPFAFSIARKAWIERKRIDYTHHGCVGQKTSPASMNETACSRKLPKVCACDRASYEPVIIAVSQRIGSDHLSRIIDTVSKG